MYQFQGVPLSAKIGKYNISKAEIKQVIYSRAAFFSVNSLIGLAIEPTHILNAVKVGFVICKGVFVAYIFYFTNQCAFIMTYLV